MSKHGIAKTLVVVECVHCSAATFVYDLCAVFSGLGTTACAICFYDQLTVGIIVSPQQQKISNVTKYYIVRMENTNKPVRDGGKKCFKNKMVTHFGRSVGPTTNEIIQDSVVMRPSRFVCWSSCSVTNRKEDARDWQLLVSLALRVICLLPWASNAFRQRDIT